MWERGHCRRGSGSAVFKRIKPALVLLITRQRSPMANELPWAQIAF